MKKKKRGIEAHNRFVGRMFILPWEIGMVFFVIMPLILSVVYAFCEVNLELGGMKYDFVALTNFKYLLSEDPYYTDTLLSSLTNLLYSVPIIISISLILGIILNQKFKGRTAMRAVFFLPVIIAAGIVLNILTTPISGQPPIIQLGSGSATAMSESSNYLDATALLEGLRFPQAVTDVMSKYITMIFNLLWHSGIQIVLFISGLQTIPDSLYEVSKIEGASKWEEFWMITFPMLRDVTLLVTVFTVVEEMVSTTNEVMSNAQSMISQQRYDLPSAMIWFYFVCVLGICGILLVPLFRSFKRKWD